jgi:hypothetical protein
MTPQRIGVAISIVLGVGSCGWCADPVPSAADVQALAAKIDAAIAARCAVEKVPLAARASDAELLRPSYLNLAGAIPTAAEARAYFDDASSDKHQRHVERLLAGSAYVEYFTTIWRKLLVPELSNGGDGAGELAAQADRREVDPVDDLEGQNAPSPPELLQELAAQFAGHGFDAKFLIRAITASEAYQRSSRRQHSGQDDARLFTRMAVKGLSPEQVHAVLVQATGYQESSPPVGPMAAEALSVGRRLRAEVQAQFNDPGERPTEGHTSIPQALLLMNGSSVSHMTDLKNGTLAAVTEDKALDTAGRIEALFLAALSRRPTKAEADRLVKHVESGGPDRDPKKALADVFGALLNSSEFILNH